MANAPPLLDGVLTFGPVAEKLGIKFWQLSRLYDTGKLPRATKLENMRLVHESELPRIREAAVQAGYLELTEAEAAAGIPRAKRGRPSRASTTSQATR